MKLTMLLLVVGLSMCCVSCKSAEPTTAASDSVEFKKLLKVLESQSYRIDIDEVMPFNTAATTKVLNTLLLPNTGNSAARIDVRGAGHYLEVRGDHIKASLPYFGEQRQGGGQYGSTNSGIEIDGESKDHELLPNEGKNQVVIQFTADDGNRGAESYNVIMTSFLNGRMDIIVSSSHRTSLRYTGTLGAIK